MREYIRNLGSIRSPYELRGSLRFAWRHCPTRLVAFFITQYYARYVYAALKSRVRSSVCRPMPSEEAPAVAEPFPGRAELQAECGDAAGRP